MEDFNLDNITEEQKTKIANIISKAKYTILGIGIKTSVILFGANFVSILIGMSLLQDTDPDVQVGFQFLSMFVNFIFAFSYLYRRLKKNHDIVVDEIKKVLKNDKSE